MITIYKILIMLGLIYLFIKTIDKSNKENLETTIPENKSTEVNSAEVKPTDIKPTAIKPTDIKPIDIKPTDIKPVLNNQQILLENTKPIKQTENDKFVIEIPKKFPLCDNCNSDDDKISENDVLDAFLKQRVFIKSSLEDHVVASSNCLDYEKTANITYDDNKISITRKFEHPKPTGFIFNKYK